MDSNYVGISYAELGSPLVLAWGLPCAYSAPTSVPRKRFANDANDAISPLFAQFLRLLLIILNGKVFNFHPAPPDC